MAPKKAAKKAAKKVAAKHTRHHHTQDIRRAYEHLGRVGAIMPLVPADAGKPIGKLAATAEQMLRTQRPKQAADLLRGAEHYAFGSLALQPTPDESLSIDLLSAIREEYEHLTDRAEEHAAHGERPFGIGGIYADMRRKAASAFKGHQYRAALEFARGAEALAHVHAETAGLEAGPVRDLLNR